jgi:gp16 family phage-associated protein
VNSQNLRTREEVRAWFDAQGLTVSAWARTKGFAVEQVYAVLAGRARGKRGECHRIAIELGIKARPNGEPLAPEIADAGGRKPLRAKCRETSVGT